jgi:very-short-patch-repair endonuclease
MYDELAQRGYWITPQVRVGQYRIDLVVQGHNDARLAVECDGDKYHGADKWTDDMRRQRVLERAEWVFWRCFASAFLRRRREVLDDLVRTLTERGIEPVGAEGAPRSVHVEQRVVRSATEGADKAVIRVHDPENDDPPPAAPSLTPSGLSPSGPRTQGGCRLPTDPSDVPVGVDRPIDTGTPRPDVPMAAYVEYSGEAGGDPRTVALNVVSDGIARIVAIEGPVVAKRAYDIYLRGCGIKRMGHELKRTMNKALAHAIRAGGVVAEDETGKGGVFFSVVRLKGSVPIRLRTRGPRALDEIPPSEIQILARYLGRWQGTTPGSDENLRALLECYELKRLTTQVATSVRDSLARALPYVDEFFSGLSES